MYGFPKSLQINGIVGTRLDGILIHEFQISFKFENDIELVSESEVGILINRQYINGWSQENGLCGIEIAKVIGKNIIKYEVVSENEMHFEFDNNYIICFWDKTKSYESFHVSPGNIHI